MDKYVDFCLMYLTYLVELMPNTDLTDEAALATLFTWSEGLRESAKGSESKVMSHLRLRDRDGGAFCMRHERRSTMFLNERLMMHRESSG